MNKVLTWLKANVFIVIFLAIMIAACVALPIFAGRLNEGVRSEVSRRADKLTKIQAIEKTQVELPGGESRQVVYNENLLAQVRRSVEAQQQEADEVYQAAIDHNRKGRGVLMPELFPEPPDARREVLPQKFHERLVRAYEDLLDEIAAGSPPDPEDVRTDLNRRRLQFLSQTLLTEDESTLDEEQLERLRSEMRETRTSIYMRRAQDLKLYATDDAVFVPAWDPTRTPSPAELFGWQWDYWIHQDILRAIALANEDARTVVDAPVKRLVVVQIVDGGFAVPASGGAAGSGGGGPAGFGPSGMMGRRGAGGDGGGGGEAAAATGTPLNPRVEAPMSFDVSVTGRQTNPLYDVKYVEVVLVVDPRRVPEIMNAFARQNFITVTNLRMEQADPFAALREGLYYGSGPLAQLTLQLETIWLRPWTIEFMPDAVKQALGVPLAPPPGATEDPA